MKLHNKWGYGQLFGFSGLDGTNRYTDDFVGTLTRQKIGIRFELTEWVKVKFDIKGRIAFKAITGDIIEAKTEEGDFLITFSDADTLIGYSPAAPKFIGQKRLARETQEGVELWYNQKDFFAVKKEGAKFCICHAWDKDTAVRGAIKGSTLNVEHIKNQRYAYYITLPKCKDKKYEKLYYKTLSVQKVNVKTAEGKIPYMWTTPNRVPHRHMWLWDSVFHALAIVNYNQELAKSAIKAVLSQAKEDGFMPHSMNPKECSKVTQPQVLSWGVWEVYQKTGDKRFLEDSVAVLEGYLEWDMNNRDKNGNGLLEWATNPDEPTNKCDECGQDDSPRFDFDEEMDAVDFSTFACNDARYLSYIFNELGEEKKAKKWQDISNVLKEKINELLWDERDGVYYDRLFGGEFSKILTPSSFFPLMANIPSKERAAKMVRALTDENLLWTKNPLATVAKSHPTFSNGMWRGGVWLNLNYFIIIGLKNYGYDDIANELKEKTLQMVYKWYQKTGTVSEFYDPTDKVPPYMCDRKGPQPKTPDWRKKMHAINDFNWSSCFTMLLLQDIIY